MKIEDKNIDKLFKILEKTDKIGKLTDAELSERVINEVWATIGYGSDRELLLDEMVRRFDKFAGIKRDCNGEITE